MRTMLLPAVTCLALLGLVNACDSSDDNSVTLNETNNGQTVAMAVGGQLEVVLKGNPTTGYEWTTASVNAAVLQPQGSEYSPDSSAVGAGGTYVFRYNALTIGQTVLKLVYRRSWEPAPIQTFQVTVQVR